VAEGRAQAVCADARQLCMPSDAPESFNDLVTRWLAEPTFLGDTTLREAALASLRYCIEHTKVEPEFADLLDQRVSEVFETARVKIRSSTNSEDLPNFSGAGLYDSYAANGDKPLPSQVVTRVFASVWNFRAFEERAYWNIDHQAVRMGCAINQAFTDELANGVLITESIADPARYGMYVNVQKGEVEVVNPPDGTLPEIFTIFGDSGYEIARQRFSSLSPDQPLLTDSEIASLYEASDKARAHFAKLYGRSAGQLILDIEFKLTPERVIVLKQARPYTPRAN
jgi:phosphoenolpyruvate synthase/pyruvate phosphate dikinase